VNQPKLVYHADWSSTASKRWCATATLSADGRYVASVPEPVGDTTQLIGNLRKAVGNSGIVFAGFDYPVGVPEHYAKRARISKFRELLPLLGEDEWAQFWTVCETPDQISVHRPFYPNRSDTEPTRQHLFDGHRVAEMAALLRRCELGGDGQRQACSLFWTLGGSQVGKAAIVGWRDMLVPALQSDLNIRLWPFDGSLNSLFQPGYTVIAETYPAECYGWFTDDPPRSKRDINCRKEFGDRLMSWAQESGVAVEDRLRSAILDGFSIGEDDAFDAVVGLFGMLKVCLGQRTSGEPEDATTRDIEGWILGRQSSPDEDIAMVYSANTDPDLSDTIAGRCLASSKISRASEERCDGRASTISIPMFSRRKP
jgi:hypothetical protein